VHWLCSFEAFGWHIYLPYSQLKHGNTQTFGFLFQKSYAGVSFTEFLSFCLLQNEDVIVLFLNVLHKVLSLSLNFF
jgi:hypothetical protein